MPSPTARQPWRTPIPSGPSEAIAAATIASCRTRAVVELVGAGHPEAVPGAASDERDAGAGHGVGAADDLLLVSGEPVGEQQQHAVLAIGDVAEAGGSLGACRASVSCHAGDRRGRDAEALAAQRDRDHAGVAGTVGADLPGGGAADQARAAAGSVSLGDKDREIERRGREQHEEPSVAPRAGAGHRRSRGSGGVAVGRPPHADPAVLITRSVHASLFIGAAAPGL